MTGLFIFGWLLFFLYKTAKVGAEDFDAKEKARKEGRDWYFRHDGSMRYVETDEIYPLGGKRW